jgi:catalase (peroxidase I)
MHNKAFKIFSEDNLRRGSEFTPWYSGQNKFANQSGTGGFLKVRDVLPHTTVSIDITLKVLQLNLRAVKRFLKNCVKNPKAWYRCNQVIYDCILVRLTLLSPGTNKLASQRGMTGFGNVSNRIIYSLKTSGTPRNTLLRNGWKKEWYKLFTPK